MKIDDCLLLKYVEHQLDETTMAAIERALEEDKVLRDKVQALKTAQLPYDAAFAVQHLPSVPEHLHHRIEQLVQVTQGEPRSSSLLPFGRVSMAVCFSLAFTMGILITTLADHWLNKSDNSENLTTISWLEERDAKVLVDAMIQYQALYTRATVANVHQRLVDTTSVVDTFNRQSGHLLRIPDLSQYGYKFRRVQELAYKGKTILQMVYLPEKGLPLALCVTAITGSAQPATIYHSSVLNSVLWVKNGLGYMLMGVESDTTLKALGKAIELADEIT